MREGLSFDDVLLVPKHGILNSRSEADISSELFSGVKLDVPIISANMPSVTGSKMAQEMFHSGAIGALHRFNTINENVEEYQQAGYFGVGGSIAGPIEAICSLGYHDGIERARALYLFGARYFLLDVAHGDHHRTSSFIHIFRNTFGYNVKLIVGNVASQNALVNLPIDSIDGIKVGIGPGAVCRTREVTGFGVPQLTAIMWMRKALDEAESDIKLIADGGIKNSGDIVKALAAGADTVMVGRLLAGCVEAPKGLEYYGNASHQMNGHRAPEGAHGLVEASGTVADVIKELTWGIRSGISYGGAKNLAELRKNAEFIRVSPLTALESSVRI